jgi:putative flippase GtrA
METVGSPRDKQLQRFIFVGLLNTALGLALVSFFSFILNFSPESSNALTYSLGFLVSFILNKKIVYRCLNRTYGTQLLIFFVVYLLAFFLNFIALKLLLNILPELISQIGGMCVFTIVQYYLNLKFTFIGNENESKDAW